MKHTLLSILVCFVLFCITSCKEDTEGKQSYDTKTYTVAVIMPMKKDVLKERYLRTAEWLKENIAHAQTGQQHRVELNIEWIEEEADDEKTYLNTIGNQLMARDDVAMVIGPQKSADCDIIANILTNRKLMITTTATSDELLRKYANKNFFWALCESDITQCEVLLLKAQEHGARSVSLLADETTYGQTFRNWFAFQAEEMGLNVGKIYTHDKLAEAMRDTANYMICVPDNADDVKNIIEAHNKAKDQNPPSLLFSDIALDPSLLTDEAYMEGVEGVCPYADPSSGFEIAYRARFNAEPSFDEIELYDALMLSGLILKEYDNRQRANELTSDDMRVQLNNIMIDLMATTDKNGNALPRISAWNYEDMYKVMNNPGSYNISGASGTLDFDVTMQSSVAQSVYCHWLVYNNKFISLDFLCSDASNRPSQLSSAWVWKPSVTQIIPEEDVDIDYSDRQSNWAILVGGSTGWLNYRFQSDVLHMYQLLRKNGFDDDHIILIASLDSLLDNPANLYKGEIRCQLNGVNLYNNVTLDYCTDSLVSSDICNILLGNRSSHLPTVLDTDEHSNILFYWSGHGDPGAFRWMKNYDAGFKELMLKETLNAMHESNKYRKMLICAEPCFSASVVSAADNIPGILGIASADQDEMSWADVNDTNLGVYLSNRFSNTLINNMETSPNMSFYNLYMNLTHNTYGSHVRVLNYLQYGNLHIVSPNEFFIP